jgi:hypothetical protein
MTMLIKKALTCAMVQKTDDELKAIMATHPLVRSDAAYGFYKAFGGVWEKHGIDRGYRDAIWFDVGIARGSFVKTPRTSLPGDWMAKGFHTPRFHWPLHEDDEERERELREQWWRTTVTLLIHRIPRAYLVYAIYYGEVESKDDDVETYFYHAPEVEAALGLPLIA